MIDRAVELIQNANNLVVLTGAGISTESGVPDYRSSGGLWDGLKPEEISHWKKIGTPEFRKFFVERYKEFNEHSPNIAHEILAKWGIEKEFPIITQNIDGYHQQAGSNSVIEMHGHMRHLQCTECATAYDWSKFTLFDDDECEYCGGSIHGGVLRPPVILFGEHLPALSWHRAVIAMQRADTILVIGTSLQVAPFNELIDVAFEFNEEVKLIILTGSETPYDDAAHVRSHEGIGDTLTKIDKKLNQGDKTNDVS